MIDRAMELRSIEETQTLTKAVWC